MILLDTSGLFAALDASEPLHEPARASLLDDPGPFVLSPFVLAELDYLLTSELGPELELAFLDEVAGGAYELAPFAIEDVASARKTIERYRDLNIGLADASVVLLADRYRTNVVLTLDERHFRALRGPSDRAFRLLPADA